VVHNFVLVPLEEDSFALDILVVHSSIETVEVFQILIVLVVHKLALVRFLAYILCLVLAAT